MSGADILRASWTLFGLEAPRFAWLAAGILPLWTALMLVRLAAFVGREVGGYRRLTRRFQVLAAAHPRVPTRGLALAALEPLRQAFATVPALGAAWGRLEVQIVVRPEGEDVGAWTLASAAEALSDAAVVGPRLNRGFYVGFPGVVTGLGLLVTFLAILVALVDVRLEANQVRGLDTLIRGLSGKFISSIAALASASVFLLLEKPLLHTLDTRRRELVAALDAILPPFGPVHLLLRIRDEAATQSATVRRFTDDLAGVLRRFGDQSVETQTALREMVRLARTTTEEQAARGRDQVEELTGLMRILLHQTSETAGATLTQVTTTLTGVVHELTGGLTRFQEDLARRMADGTERTAAVVHTILGEAEHWLVDSSVRLAGLLERHETHEDRLAPLLGGLDGLLGRVQASLGQYAALAADLQGVTRQLGGVAATLQSASASLGGAAEHVGRAADLTAANVTSLAATRQEQEATWARALEGLQRYQEIFGQVERSASDLLGQVAHHLTSYTEATRRSFSETIGLSHDYLSDATARLSGSIDDLDEHLQGLREVLDATLRPSRGRA
jgi:ABC-type transporter Mla subunit MlaD